MQELVVGLMERTVEQIAALEISILNHLLSQMCVIRIQIKM